MSVDQSGDWGQTLEVMASVSVVRLRIDTDFARHLVELTPTQARTLAAELRIAAMAAEEHS